MGRLAREMAKGNCWTERDNFGKRIYWCWHVRAGAFGMMYVRRTLIGRVK